MMSAYQESQSIVVEQGVIAVVRVDQHYRVATTRAVAQGDAILELVGERRASATRYSVQVGIDEHLDAPLHAPQEDLFDFYPWRCLNHSCEPNAVLRGTTLVALRDLAPWEQVTFDYNTTEYELATPFSCSCGALSCCGLVRGFRYLSSEERLQRAPLTASYLGNQMNADN